ncbi:MAG: DnaJ domain protein [Edafosvirus sp.]|uniref:DnaJ domain protein n=1 Tax=Edafosvirus sp. TaxID=2487765 RepID=A0A3G4ZUW9_9VIRU|nr:MAG: DnaJ domain protein [Edafosvirus sp.]
MSTVNLYDVLGLPSDCTKSDIKKTYGKLVKTHHPDKGGNKELFELITHAYTVLKNTQTRAEYDEIYNLSKQIDIDHLQLKESANQFLKAQNTSVVSKTKDEASKDFNMMNEDYDRKHKFNRNEQKNTIPIDDTEKHIKDMELIRNQTDIENTPDNLFEKNWNLKKFNDAFDHMHKTHTELMVHVGNPGAFDNTIMGSTTNFSSIDNFDKVYEETDEPISNNSFSSIKLDNKKHKKLTKKDIIKLQGADYTEGHKTIDSDYNKFLEEKMQERKTMGSKIGDKKLNDFDNDPSMGGYGIFHQLGINGKEIAWENNNNDLKKKYDRLLEMRKNNTKK